MLNTSHDNKELVGTFIESYVLINNSYDEMLYISPKNRNEAKDGDRVICSLDNEGEYQICKIINDNKNKNKTIISEILQRYDVKSLFTEKTIKTVSSIPNIISDVDKKDRVDLTNKMIFTIDGDDTMDMDDAVSIEKIGEKYVLGVHIADVSHYVTECSSLDKEASERGCSIYMIDSVVPMLPSKLSDNLCSLVPGEVRLTLSVEMIINSIGEVEDYNIYKSYIKSVAKLKYGEVSNFIEENDINFINKYPNLISHIKYMNELSKILYKKRLRIGMVNLQCRKTKISIKNSKVIDIVEYKKRAGHLIIEEFMLMCNEVVAKHCKMLNIPFIYRVHETPKKEKVEVFLSYLNVISEHVIEISDVGIQPIQIQNILEHYKNHKEFDKINLMLLKCMQQAKYGVICEGHFGLGKKYYCHFTSPIRRYPDLMVHRIIKESMEGVFSINRRNELENKVFNAARQASNMERIAQFIEIEYKQLKHIEFLSNKIGVKYNATISDINDGKISVMLDNAIEGVLRLNVKERNDNNFNYVECTCNIQGEQISVGDKVIVEVYKANIKSETLEFNMISKVN